VLPGRRPRLCRPTCRAPGRTPGPGRNRR
jgi:hypothetical protein